MTDYTSEGFIRPDDNAPIAQAGAAIRQHSNSIQMGTFTISVAQTDTVVNVPFPEAFAAEPVRVLCSIMTLGLWTVLTDVRWGKQAGSSAGDGTTTGFVFQARRTAGNPAPMRVNYVAIGRGTTVGG